MACSGGVGRLVSAANGTVVSGVICLSGATSLSMLLSSLLFLLQLDLYPALVG